MSQDERFTGKLLTLTYFYDRKLISMKKLGVYVHIPFCVKKCDYCDFLSASASVEKKKEYVKWLCKEIENQYGRYKEYVVDTIFIGGGTPSILEPEDLRQILETVRSRFPVSEDAEISMEMNPGTAEEEKIIQYAHMGINRLSIGLQTADNRELERLGRIHTWEDFLETWRLVRMAGFSNVNVDLMSALPGQTMESLSQTIEKVLALQPEHISAYSLIVEENTPFYQWYGPEGKKQKELPDEQTDRQMYELTKEMLQKHGYERYEISNYARKGNECKHNIGYWTGKDYVGFGLGASSFVKHIRFQNETDLATYQKKVMLGQPVIMEQQTISIQEQMEEFMFLGLRMMKGVSPDKFKEQFGESMYEVYGEQITKLMGQKLLKQCPKTGNISLTDRGIDVSNQVFVEFLF